MQPTLIRKMAYTQHGRAGLVFAVLLVVVLAAAWWYLAPVVRAGSGFAAKNICSGHFISGLPGQTVVDQALAGASPLLADVSFDIDSAAMRVQTSIFGLFTRRAQFEPGAGCTLQPSDGSEARQDLVLQDAPTLDSNRRWPHGSMVAPANAALQEIVRRAFAEPDPVAAPRNTNAVVVVHQGQIIAEHYADGIDAQTPLIGWSMSKSVTNLLLGLLVADERLAVTEAAPIAAWQTQPDDPRAAITIDQLLRMSSSLQFDEDYGFYSDVSRMLSNEPDMAAFAASKELAGPVDSIWSYSSGTTNILSRVLRQTLGGSGQAVYDFAQTRLFQPLGIRTAMLEMDATGNPVGSSFLHASARDWARLGLLCLQNGRWQDEQLLPADWMAYSVTPTPTDSANSYGAHFWLNRRPNDPAQSQDMPSLPEDMYSMNGYQGQRVIIIPSEDLIVVRLGTTPAGNHGVEALTRSVLDHLKLQHGMARTAPTARVGE